MWFRFPWLEAARRVAIVLVCAAIPLVVVFEIRSCQHTEAALRGCMAVLNRCACEVP